MFRLEKLTDKAVLTIYGYVGGAYLDFRAVEQALHEVKSDGYRNLDFWMHTYGGDVVEGNLMKNFMESFCKNGEIDLYMPGVLASMGAVMMTAATRRHIARNGYVMIHAPSGGCYGNAKDMNQTGKLLTSMEKNFIAELCAITGKPAKEVAQWMDGSDYWFDASECLSNGLVTSIIDAQVTDIQTLSKTEAKAMGARAVYGTYSAITTVNLTQTNMDKQALITMHGLSGVTAQSSDADIMAAMQAKKAETDRRIADSDRKATEAQATADNERAQREALESGAIASAVDAAVSAGKITAAKKEEYIARGKKIGITELNAIFADMGVREPIVRQIGANGKTPATGGEDRSAWSWKDYQAKAPDALEAMPKADPEAFKALYKAEYGNEPKF